MIMYPRKNMVTSRYEPTLVQVEWHFIPGPTKTRGVLSLGFNEAPSHKNYLPG